MQYEHRRYTLDATTYRIKQGPAGEPIDVRGPTADDIAYLDEMVERGGRFARSPTDPCVYVVIG